MIAVELIRVTDFIESRWGSLPKAWSNTQAMAEVFQPFTAGAVLEALHELFNEGTATHEVIPSKVMKRTGLVQARRWESGVDERPERACQGVHVWAVVHYPGAALVPDECGELVEHQWCALCMEERFLTRKAA